MRSAITTFIFLGSAFLSTLMISSCTQLSAEQSDNESLAADELPSLAGKKILLVYGGWPGHKPDEFAEMFDKLLTDLGATVTLSDTTQAYADSSLLANMDLIIQSVTMSKLTDKQAKGLMHAVRNGVGFAGAHGGFCDSFRDHTKYQYMTGGQFVSHPGGQITFTVTIPEIDDPILNGLESFEIKTEQYYMHMDPNVKVLATSVYSGEHDQWIEGATMPVAWKKYFGKGRIFFLSIGHDPKEFNQPMPQKFLINGFRWASGSKYSPKEDWLNPVY